MTSSAAPDVGRGADATSRDIAVGFFDRHRATDFVHRGASPSLYAAFESQQSVLHTAERS